MKSEKHGFEAEVSRLLHMMVHSVYSEREIFLRELISNASDACDKLRYEGLTNEKLLDGTSDFAIDIRLDKDTKTLTISDNGIGMNKKDLISHLGTIARSGTSAFVDNMSGDEKSDTNLIGQFGVGFYSAFIVADEVTLTTRKAGDDKANGTVWTSKGEGDYSLETTNVEDFGTTITLHIKDDEKEFLDDYRLRGIISKYSDHITVPIMMIKASEEESDTIEYETVKDRKSVV